MSTSASATQSSTYSVSLSRRTVGLDAEIFQILWQDYHRKPRSSLSQESFKEIWLCFVDAWLRLGRSNFDCENCAKWHGGENVHKTWRIFKSSVKNINVLNIDGTWIYDANQRWKEVEDAIIKQMEGRSCSATKALR